MSKIYFRITKILVVLSIMMFLACTEELPVINRFENQDEIPTVAAENVKMTYTEKGYSRGLLLAEILKNYDMVEDPYVKFPKGIKITLFDKNHMIETEMEADSAIYFPDKQTWEAMGHVVVKNVNGTVLRTEKLYGDESEKKIYTNKLVNITKSDGTLVVGKTGFMSNTEFTIYKFLDMYGRFYVSEAGNDSIQPADNQYNDRIPNLKFKPSRLPENMKKPEYLKPRK